MDTAVGRWLGEDATGARLAVVAPRDTPEGYAGTLAALFTELPRRLVLGMHRQWGWVNNRATR